MTKKEGMIYFIAMLWAIPLNMFIVSVVEATTFQSVCLGISVGLLSVFITWKLLE